MDRPQRRVAGLDVHKDTVFLCIMDNSKAKIFERVYSTYTPSLEEMRRDMVTFGVTEAAMESTATYWIPVWNALCGSMALKLANPYFIKQLPGRKSDVKDAQWIAECLVNDTIRGSFVPDAAVRDMRKYNRRIFDLQEYLTYNTNKLDSLLQGCGFRLSNLVSKINCKSYTECVKAISSGTTDPKELVELVHGRTKNKHGRQAVLDALTADFHAADIDLIRQYLEMVETTERHIEDCQQQLTALCKEHFPKQFERLQTIPGVKERAASSIIAETGADMEPFEKATDIVGWCGLKPRNDESNRKIKSNKITHGNRFLRQILIEVSWVAARTRNCFFSNYSFVQCTQRHKSKMKVQVAIARKVLVAVWHMLHDEEDFKDIYLERLKKQTGEEKKRATESSMA